MIFARQKVELPHGLVIANTPIERKSEARFLGVIVDEKLSWSKHISTLKTKMSRYVGIMFKIKSLIPVQVRLQIFHSFIQSHINYCSLVWGFSAKSNIESLFVKQKKGMRAVMPGYASSYYKDGKIPTHTKASFNKFKVLTVQGIVVKNALVFMQKVKYFPRTLPLSVKETIARDAPVADSNHETCEEWLNNFNNSFHRKSVFYKAPLLSIDTEISQLTTPTTLFSIKAYKNSAKRFLLELQGRGDVDEWQAVNFLLYNIRGLRQSSRQKE